MEKKRKQRKTDSAKLLFRERWNKAFSKLNESEAKRYCAIIQASCAFSGIWDLPKSQIYLVKKGENNSNYSILNALEYYVALK